MSKVTKPVLLNETGVQQNNILTELVAVQKATHRYHPKQRPNIADYLLGVVSPLGFLAAPGLIRPRLSSKSATIRFPLPT